VRRIDIATHPSTDPIVAVSSSVSVSGECLPSPINSVNCREIIIKQSAVMRMGYQCKPYFRVFGALVWKVNSVGGKKRGVQVNLAGVFL